MKAQGFLDHMLASETGEKLRFRSQPVREYAQFLTARAFGQPSPELLLRPGRETLEPMRVKIAAALMGLSKDGYLDFLARAERDHGPISIHTPSATASTSALAAPPGYEEVQETVNIMVARACHTGPSH
jgi:hypothetical protein